MAHFSRRAIAPGRDSPEPGCVAYRLRFGARPVKIHQAGIGACYRPPDRAYLCLPEARCRWLVNSQFTQIKSPLVPESKSVTANTLMKDIKHILAMALGATALMSAAATVHATNGNPINTGSAEKYTVSVIGDIP